MVVFPVATFTLVTGHDALRKLLTHADAKVALLVAFAPIVIFALVMGLEFLRKRKGKR